MPLDRTTLETQIRVAFEKAKETPAPENPSPEDIDALQVQILTDLAGDLADAIDAFVRSGDVVDVTTDVTVDTGSTTLTGTGTQTGTGRVD